MQKNVQKRYVMIACEMIRSEIERAAADHHFNGEIIWNERGLHSSPKRLRAALQAQINQFDENGTVIILGHGMCGNGTIGLHVEKAVLVVPKFDDCIRMSLSFRKGEAIHSDAHTLYYTGSWMEDRGSEGSEVFKTDHYIRQYGEENGMKLIKMMLDSYDSCTFIDTGLYDVEACREELKPYADRLGMRIRTTPGTLRVYKKLAEGKWDEEFVLVPPGGTLSESDFAGRPRVI